MAGQLRPSAARLTADELTLRSRQAAAVARIARAAGCNGVAALAAGQAVYYRNRRAVATQPERASRRRGRAA